MSTFNKNTKPEEVQPHGIYPDGTPMSCCGGCVSVAPKFEYKTYGNTITISLEDIERSGFTFDAKGRLVPKPLPPFSIKVWLRNAYAVTFVWLCRIRTWQSWF